MIDSNKKDKKQNTRNKKKSALNWAFDLTIKRSITPNVMRLLLLFAFPHSLKYLNVSANALETIPPSSQSEESLSTLQELYLTGNKLNENCGALLVGHQNLRVLHVAYNQLLSFPARCVTVALMSVRTSKVNKL